MPLLTAFDPWKNKYCTCPAKLSLSPYTGCAHNCLYCYATSYIRDFSSPRPKKEFIQRLGREIKKIPANSIITIANSSDPYQPIEEKLELTREMLLLLKNCDFKINIVTKSILVLRDLDILKDIRNIVLSFTFTSLDKKLAQKLEPGCSASPREKLKAMAALSKYIPIAARFDPLIYPVNTEHIKETIKILADCGVKQIIASTYKTKPDNFKRMLGAFPQYASLWKNLYFDKGGKNGGYNYLDAVLREKLIREARETAQTSGLKFSSCREDLNGLNSARCDGSSLFRAL